MDSCERVFNRPAPAVVHARGHVVKLDVDTLWKFGAGGAALAAIATLEFFSNHPSQGAQSDLIGGASADAAVVVDQPPVTSCRAASTMAEFNRCAEGKTRRQIAEDLGKPFNMTFDGPNEVWDYSSSQVNVTDDNGFKLNPRLLFNSISQDGVVALVEYPS